MDYNFIRIIAKRNMIKAHISCNMHPCVCIWYIVITINRQGVWGFLYFFPFSQKLKYTLCGSCRLLKHRRDTGNLRQGLCKRTHILNEGLYPSDSHLAVNSEISSQNADGNISKIADEVDDRRHQA